jgi:hypothetical protein
MSQASREVWECGRRSINFILKAFLTDPSSKRNIVVILLTAVVEGVRRSVLRRPSVSTRKTSG